MLKKFVKKNWKILTVMSALSKYQEEIRKIFFISIEKDIEKWQSYNNGKYYLSPTYEKNQLILYTRHSEYEKRYRLFLVNNGNKIIIFKY